MTGWLVSADILFGSGAPALAAGAPSLAAVALLAVSLCAGVCSAASDDQNGAKPQFGNWGVDLAAMDKSVKPGDDFFAFVNGTCVKNAVIPPDRPYWG